jgi:TatA/E family protein of Tat protein translocase
MFGLGFKEIVLIVVVFVLLFGSRKLPELSQSIVDSVRNLRKIFGEDQPASPDQNAKKRS